MNITNKIMLYWKVEDDTYPYARSSEFTKEEIAALDWDALLVKQTEEYNAWHAHMISIEGQQ